MSQHRTTHEPAIDAKYLAEIEQTAVELANLAGAEIKTALGGMLTVRYKTGSEAEQIWQDPVSETDHRIEELIRARLAKSFPEHDIIGEELDEIRSTGRPISSTVFRSLPRPSASCIADGRSRARFGAPRAMRSGQASIMPRWAERSASMARRSRRSRIRSCAGIWPACPTDNRTRATGR
jgi:3'-phosphoadenosine 5'-phosphosulfate (PAPS) 3'-phosphatase